jgi:hypothetical protein
VLRDFHNEGAWTRNVLGKPTSGRPHELNEVLNFFCMSLKLGLNGFNE